MCRRGVIGAALAIAALGAAAPAARAGSYTVNACTVAGTNWGNGSWLTDPAPGILADGDCGSAGAIGTRVPGGTRGINQGAEGRLTFRAPSRMTIADFALTRQLTFRNPTPEGQHKVYALYRLGGTVFAGAGNYDDATRNRLNAVGSWHGYPDNNVVVPTSTVSRASFPALAGYRGDAATLQLAIGCFPRSSPCGVGDAGEVRNRLYGAQVVLNDPTAPRVSIEASGLLAGGQRLGSDPVTLDASDNGGIRRVEILDASDGGARVVGSEDYAAGVPNDRGARCSFAIAKACPNLTNETVRPSSLEPGHRTLRVRVVDAGGNVVEQGPYSVDVITPSDRGARNGTDATDDGSLTARFRGSKRTRRTVSYGDKVRITGRLLNSSGRPIGGAELRILTRDLRQGARATDRGAVRTRSDGVYVATVRARASRLIQIAWRAYVNDPRFQENAYVTLKTRAAASLRASRRAVGLGTPLRLSGTVRGTVPSRGVPLIFQGRRGSGRYRTFADGRANRRGRFSVRYRFRDASSRGRTFTFRVKLRGDSRFPYALGYSKRVRVRVF